MHKLIYKNSHMFIEICISNLCLSKFYFITKLILVFHFFLIFTKKFRRINYIGIHGP